MQNGLNTNKWWRSSVHKTFITETEKGRPNNSDFLQNWFHLEIRSTLLNLYKFQNHDKSTPESRRMHWSLINDEDFWYIKTLRLKYRTRDQIIQTFSRIVSAWKLGCSFLICRNFKTLRKILLNHAECIEI